ncbi:sensor domain-containing protein [Actinoallomurus purpureus]|uniref:sensor histidine kinase n=1 Tax=Actinoallomurus purpureus TaxID=478114 RepID=UPI002093EDA4|nr:sensor histidine kinase [Actinoallomurus purpureus]MCO6010247.1 sensor domain-containing protein [Actinoallomurus purpureus]
MSDSAPRTAFDAVLRRRFLISGWPWRCVAYLLTAAAPLAAAAVPLVLLGLPWVFALRRATGRDPAPVTVALLAVLGVLLVAGVGPLVAVPLAELERRRLRLVDARPIASGHRTVHGVWARLRTRYGEAATWRELGYLCLLLVVAPVVYLVLLVFLLLVGAFLLSPLLARGGRVALGFGSVADPMEALPYALAGLALVPTIPYLTAVVAGAHAAVARALLGRGPDERLRAELVEVSRSRARLVGAFETERRRIERDLHDGAQQRLVSLTLQLGMARLDVPPDSPAALSVADAHEQAKRLMTELRELIRGIHPRVLTDRGLPAALREIADRSTIPVTVDAELPDRLPAHVEGTAYFVVSEALANVAKHSGASEAVVTVRRRGDLLTVEVRDDGNGGADPREGTGLTGLADRVAVIDGRMLLSSPVGGPTIVQVELPCGKG